MIFDKVAQLIAEQFGIDVEELSEDTTMEDLDADSVDVMELAMSLEEEFEIDELDEDDLSGIRTVGDLVTLLQNKGA